MKACRREIGRVWTSWLLCRSAENVAREVTGVDDEVIVTEPSRRQNAEDGFTATSRFRRRRKIAHKKGRTVVRPEKNDL